jgi:divalent metal cation (Fe/Co/Zn/Cd) transporter
MDHPPVETLPRPSDGAKRRENNGMCVLLDASVDTETLGQILQNIENDSASDRIKNLTGRNSGRYRFIEAEIRLRIDVLNKGHLVSQRIKRQFGWRYPLWNEF